MEILILAAKCLVAGSLLVIGVFSIGVVNVFLQDRKRREDHVKSRF
jgi:hypothetical protein